MLEAPTKSRAPSTSVPAGSRGAVAPISARAFDTPHRFLDVGHSRIASWTFGSGPDLVFVHGWPLSAATYRAVAAPLSQSFTCHLVDLPGAGRTITTPATPIELRAHARTLRAAIDRLALESYAFVGHDSGGFVARLVAADDARVRGLVLSNTEITGHTPPMLLAYMSMAKSGLAGALLPALLRSPRLCQSPLGFGGCFEDPSFVQGDFHALFLRPLLESKSALAGAIALLRNADHRTLQGLEAVHAKIRVPVKLVWGARDPWFPLAKARAMLPELGGPASLVEIAGAKLFVHEERPAELAAHAAPFLSECFGGAPLRDQNASGKITA